MALYEDLVEVLTPYADGINRRYTRAEVDALLSGLEDGVNDELDHIKAVIDELDNITEITGTYCQELEVDENGLVYLLNNGKRIAGPYGPFAGSGGGGGGGGSGNNARLTVENTTGWLSTSIAYGSACPISLNWSSIEDEMPTGDGSLSITVNNVVKTIFNVHQGAVNVDLAPYLAAGSNTVRIRLSDIYDNARTVNFSITCVAISISSTFDDSVAYSGSITFPYTPVGAVENKVVHFIINGTDRTKTTGASGRELTYTIPSSYLHHGANSFECYFTYTDTVSGQEVYSNRLYYDIVYVSSGDNSPIIASSYRETEVSQYSNLNIPYIAYTPAANTSAVDIYVNGTLYTSITVNRSRQIFAYRADTPGTLVIRIMSGSAYKDFTLTVTESDIDVEAETDQLKLYLSATGRSNGEENPASWVYNGDEVISATFTNFNFVSDGWVQDSDGTTVLRVSGDARVTIPYKIFASSFARTGKTIEFDFATRSVMDYDANCISCMYNGRGVSITAQLARLTSEQSSISMQYKENEHVRVTFVVDKSSQDRLVYIYVNGIMSGVVQYPPNDDFSQAVPADIVIGSNDCTVDIYNIRIYDTNLTRSQVLNNWIADSSNITDLLARYRRNDVYDAYGNIVMSKLPTGLPYMIIEGPELPSKKGDKKNINVTYVDPVNQNKSFTSQNAQIDVQGTSSQAYPRKNYKVKFNNGFVMENGTTSSKYAMRSDSVPTKTFCFKADYASSEGANNVELVRLYNEICPYRTAGQRADSKVRQGIDGFPMVIFWHDTINDETTFLGKYNFNNDKGTSEVFGFFDDDESWETLVNNNDLVDWRSDDYESTVIDQDGKEMYAWLNSFEARFPDTDPPYQDPTQLKAFSTWIKSTNTDDATDEALPSSVTYNGVEYTHDTEEYRLAKFRAELGNYVELDSTIFYYLFTELFLMVDSRSKNSFPSFMGTEVIGQ